MNAATTTERLHAFDALRGVMMLLGLVLHSAMSYVTFDTGDDWPFKDPSPDIGLDLLVIWIHVFRMPVFFVVAGFFGALLYQRRGLAAFVRNRLKRIALPMAIAWPLLLPLVIGASIYGQSQLGTLPNFGDQRVPLAEIFDHTMHLWFLYYLLLYYALVFVAIAALSGRSHDALAKWRVAIGRRIDHGAAPLLLAVISYPVLATMETGSIDISDSFLPPLRSLLAYGLFFAFGWLLFDARERLSWFATRAWRHCALGFVGLVIYVVVMDHAFRHPGDIVSYQIGMGALAVSGWFWVYGWLGLFLRYFGRARHYGRYAADASYWMYLVHLPLTLWLPALWLRPALPGIVKFAGVLAITTAITLFSYHAFVRSTAIGELLNGRRYPPTRLRP